MVEVTEAVRSPDGEEYELTAERARVRLWVGVAPPTPLSAKQAQPGR